VWVEISPDDAASLAVAEGDLLRVESPRGALEAPARVCGIRPGVVFVPFHYGYWDRDDGVAPGGATGRAANELTMTSWDPVSKQPLFKVAAVRVTKVSAGNAQPAPAPTTTASAPPGDARVPATIGGPAAEATSQVEEV
jgi:anaerobic selenocysteine-containing dehydrogenase